MGCMKSYDRQQSWHGLRTLPLNRLPQFKCTACSPPSSKINWDKRGQPKRACAPTLLLDLCLHTASYNASQNQLPSCGGYNSSNSCWRTLLRNATVLRSENRLKRSIWICTIHVTEQNFLNFSNALLISCASLSMDSRTINFLFKVLFIFPSRFLFAIGLVPIFSLRRSLPPILGCIPKQPDS